MIVMVKAQARLAVQRGKRVPPSLRRCWRKSASDETVSTEEGRVRGEREMESCDKEQG